MKGGPAGEASGRGAGVVGRDGVGVRSGVKGAGAPCAAVEREGRGVCGGGGCGVDVGLPEEARLAAPGRRLLAQALPPASLPAKRNPESPSPPQPS